jgi:demethylmenaquinone methyltransferase/2-methoxy-6-polyprenyl-1,4-benzoquinol methylase
MTSAIPPPSDQRFQAHAAREMAEMFDDVSARYDVLNRLMTLGRDTAWREAMWREVPDDARIVLDLCTGSGASLRGLRQPGRLLIGVDVSLAMLRMARDREGWLGWAPRLVGADAFHLPIRDHCVDCVTIAFGIRNLRPRDQALREVARVLRHGGRLIVLEATAPEPGAFAPLHRFHLLHVLPLLGRLSPDPSAYAYLGRSILEFGTADEFSQLLESAGFAVEQRRGFLLGATHLWVCAQQRSDDAARALQTARDVGSGRGRMPTRTGRRTAEWRAWSAAQLVVATVIFGVLVWANAWFWRAAPELPIEPWQRRGFELLLIVGLVGFAARSIVLLSRLFGAPPRD